MATARSPLDRSAAGNRADVLLAEDDGELRRLLAEALQRDGYRVTEVDSGHGLLDRLWDRAATKARFDLIISDVQMRGFTGLEVLEVLRDQGEPNDEYTLHIHGTPMILITAFGDVKLHADARRLGAVVFDKPFDVDELRAFAGQLVQPVDECCSRYRKHGGGD